MALDSRRTPERNSPFLGGVAIEKMTPVQKTLSTAGGAVTMTATEALGGLILCDTQDAQTLTFPTADKLAAAIPGLEVGSAFKLIIVNHGDSTLTLALGTNITQVALGGTDSVLTIATVCSKTFLFVCTEVASATDPSKANKFNVYGICASSASVS